MTFTERLEHVWRTFVRYLITPYLKPARPGQPQVILLREDGTMLIYGVMLPPSTAPDVTKRELFYVVNAGDTNVVVVTDTTELAFVDNDVVRMWLVDTDDAGNSSDPSPVLEFVAKDTIAPPAPGELGVRLIREE